MASLHHLQDLVGHFGGHDFKTKKKVLASGVVPPSAASREEKSLSLVGKLGAVKRKCVYLKERVLVSRNHLL